MDGVAFDVMMANHSAICFAVAARAEGFTGIGRYPESNFIHIDTRGDFGAQPWDDGPPFPASHGAFSTPEPQPRPVATPAGRAGTAATGAGVMVGGAVVAREVPATIEAAQGLSEPVQIALIVGVAALALALIAWGPDGIRAALRRWRGERDL